MTRGNLEGIKYRLMALKSYNELAWTKWDQNMLDLVQEEIKNIIHNKYKNAARIKTTSEESSEGKS